jgi:UDP-N-acetyl-D-galactosamine dehydrogenase
MINIEKIEIAVIGLGYVGLPLAVEFGKRFKVIGFDIDEIRVKELNNGYDRTNELIGSELLNLEKIKITTNRENISNSDVYIITVPTPVDINNRPNLKPIISASKIAGSLLKKNNLVIYESTVFPGCTEEICVPILEKSSKLKYNSDFFCGYSPERINPSDREHTFTSVTKIVSGSNEETLDFVDMLYQSVVLAGTFRASSIKIAEAAKVIENTQRDINIAIINELALIFDRLNINTNEVLEAASTKWNFLSFKPGLVGGHCIGVDPYYLTHKAIEVGYHPEIILAGRKINDNMGIFIAEKAISEIVNKKTNPINAKITIMGLAFKENCPDYRNTKVLTIIEKLNDYNCQVSISDSWVIEEDVRNNLGINLIPIDDISEQDAIIIAVGHREYFNFKLVDWKKMLKPNGVIIDVKSLYDPKMFYSTSYSYWSL